MFFQTGTDIGKECGQGDSWLFDTTDVIDLPGVDKLLSPATDGGVYYAASDNAFDERSNFVVVGKLNADGSEAWSATLNTLSDGGDSDRPNRIEALPGDGGVYVFGSFGGRFLGQPAAVTGEDFLARFDGSGNLQWLKQSDRFRIRPISPNATGSVDPIAVDGAGNLYFVARAETNFSPDPLSKFTPAGDELWSRATRRDNTELHTLAVSEDGQRIYQTLEGVPGPPIDDVLVTLSDAQGVEVWAKSFEFRHSTPTGDGGTWTGRTQGSHQARLLSRGDELFLATPYFNRYQNEVVPTDPHDNVLVAVLDGETGVVERTRQYRLTPPTEFLRQGTDNLKVAIEPSGTLNIANEVFGLGNNVLRINSETGEPID